MARSGRRESRETFSGDFVVYPLFTEGRHQVEIRLGSTSLYRILGQLLDEGFIEEGVSGRLPPHDDERRRYYRITPAGRRALAEDLRYLERVLGAARATGRSL